MKNEYDLLKVFAILLVVIGHITILYGGDRFDYLPQNDVLMSITTIIYIFHMPLFIALSGAIYNYGCEHGKYVDFLPFLLNKVLRLLLPFFTVAILFLAPTLVLLGMTRITFFECIRNIIMLDGLEKHLWYLPALFSIFIIVFLLRKCRMSVEIIFIISIVFTVICSCSCHFKTVIYNGILYGVQYLPYFSLGMMLNKHRNTGNVFLFLTGVATFVSTYIFLKNTDVVWLVIVSSVLLRCGIIMSLIAISRMIVPFEENIFLSWLLKQSFAIYLFHVMVIYTMYKNIGVYVPTIVMIPFTFIVSIIISCCLAWLIRKLHCQFIIGEKYVYPFCN